MDLDYGIYFYVILLNLVVGGVCVGIGVGLIMIDWVIGVVKVYIIRVGEGLFFIEIKDEIGELLCDCGVEFGIIIGCKCCCGWFDVVIGCYVVWINGMDCMVIIKLDVLDDLIEIKVCVVYDMEGKCCEDFFNSFI